MALHRDHDGTLRAIHVGGFRRRWRWGGTFGDVELELYPDSVDAGARELTLQELRRLTYDFTYRDREARRVVLEIYAELGGLPRDIVHSRAFDFDTGSPCAEELAERLLRAAEGGRLVARPRKSAPAIVAVDVEPESVLGPESTQEEPPVSRAWIGLVLVDQDGAPVPHRAYRVIGPDQQAYSGQLDSRGTAILKDLVPGSCQMWCPYGEPHPELAYTVLDGDHLSGVAEAYGFDDYTTVWNGPDNAALQNQRSDPHVLTPGDSLTIPELKAQPAADKPTGAKHAFTIQRSQLKLRLTLCDLALKPASGAVVTIAGDTVTTDGNGLLEATIGKGVKNATMSWSGINVNLRVGALNPWDDTTEAGYRARLVNMGFLWDPMADDTEEEMLVALQDFQAQYSLPVTGQLDDATKAQLAQSYGA